MSRFRDGDVVRIKTDDTGKEYAVVHVDRSFEPGSVGLPVRGMIVDFPPRSLVLLRRPARVGDDIRLKINGMAHTVTEDDLDPKWKVSDWPAWTHADGTAIELKGGKRGDVVALRASPFAALALFMPKVAKARRPTR